MLKFVVEGKPTGHRESRAAGIETSVETITRIQGDQLIDQDRVRLFRLQGSPTSFDAT